MSDELRCRRRQGTGLAIPDDVQASSSNGNSFNSVGLARYCFCGMLSPEQTSWTRQNPGRRFHSCPRRRGEGRCAFFKWVDPAMTDRAKEVILELRESLGYFSNSNVHVPSNASVPVEDGSSLAVEVNVLKEKITQLKRGLKMEKRKTKTLSYCLAISWLGFVVFCFIVVSMVSTDGSEGSVGAIVHQLH